MISHRRTVPNIWLGAQRNDVGHDACFSMTLVDFGQSIMSGVSELLTISE